MSGSPLVARLLDLSARLIRPEPIINEAADALESAKREIAALTGLQRDTLTAQMTHMAACKRAEAKLERAEAVIETAKRMRSYAVAGSIAHPDIIRDFDRALAAMGKQ